MPDQQPRSELGRLANALGLPMHEKPSPPGSAPWETEGQLSDYTGHTGPFIVTTKRQTDVGRDGGQTIGGPVDVIVSRRAVASLIEAKYAAREIVETRDPGNETEFFETAMLPAAGATIGPLPDGTVIEVAPSNWTDLAEPFTPESFFGNQAIIDAYNAEHANG